MMEKFHSMVEVMSNPQEIDYILGQAQRLGLLQEVVVYALTEMQKNKTTTPLLALQMAAYEWDVL